MNRFLLECRKVLGLKSLKKALVVGNESCDLDSAVSSICLAYHLTNYKPSGTNADYYIPVLNVQRDKLSLKSEVVHFLHQNEICTESLICRDEMILEDFDSYVLVDHHVSNLDNQKISMVFDHRPRDSSVCFPEDAAVTISDVGSCATLISDYILKESGNSTDDEKSVLKLLYGPIVLDTINFSPEADKARPKDVEIIREIERILDVDPCHRTKLFDELVAARCDVSELNSYQILFKDMKLIGEEVVISIPGYPIRVQEFIKMPESEKNVLRFGSEMNCDVVVLMGMKLTEGRVLRDLAIVNIKNPELFRRCQESLKGAEEFQFQSVGTFMDGPVYEQLNVKLSRKQIMPILNKLVK